MHQRCVCLCDVCLFWICFKHFEIEITQKGDKSRNFKEGLRMGFTQEFVLSLIINDEMNRKESALTSGHIMLLI